MVTTTARPPPSTPLAVRTGVWKWAEILNRGAAEAIRAASEAPDDYAKADECVRVLEAVTAAARLARDTLPTPAGSPQDQLGWLKVMMEDFFAQQRRWVGDVATTVARAIDEKLEKKK